MAMDHGSMQQMMGMGGSMMGGGMMGGFMWFWAIFWVVVLALLVAGAIWLARTLTRPSSLQAGQQGRTRREPSWISAMPAAT
jgi:uncharacterized membrane protein